MKAKYSCSTFLIVAALPCFAYANDDCRLVEYSDHYEAVCAGDAGKVPQQTVETKPATVVVVNGERRPPPAVIEDAAAARRKLILELRQKDLEMNAPASKTSNGTKGFQ